MMLYVAGSFVLLYLHLSVLGSDALLLRVDINISQIEKHRECNDILTIKRTLAHIPEIKVLLARKALDNQNVLLVLEVQDISHWSTLSSALSEKGYQLIVTPLQTCKEYARELGLDVDYLRNSIQRYQLLSFNEAVFYDKGIMTNDYISLMVRHLERDEDAMKNLSAHPECYRSYGDLPVKMMYFFPVFNDTEMFRLELIERCAGKASVYLNFLQSFESFTEVC